MTRCDKCGVDVPNWLNLCAKCATPAPREAGKVPPPSGLAVGYVPPALAARPPVDLDALLTGWRAMVAGARADGPIAGDEIGHEARWTAVELCADELGRALSRARGEG